MSDEESRRRESRKVSRDAIEALAVLALAGVSAGFGLAVLLFGLGLSSAGRPLVSGLIGIGGGIAMAWYALRKLPSAKSVAEAYESERD